MSRNRNFPLIFCNSASCGFDMCVKVKNKPKEIISNNQLLMHENTCHKIEHKTTKRKTFMHENTFPQHFDGREKSDSLSYDSRQLGCKK